MRTTTTRAANAEELSRLDACLNPKRREKSPWAATVMVAVPATFALFVLLNVLLPDTVPAILRLGVAAGLGGGAGWLYGKKATARYEESLRPDPELSALLRKDLDEGRVAVARYEALAVVKVAADPGQLVRPTWFVKLADGSVVLLVEPELEEAELAGEFPAASFEIATGESSRLVLSVRRTGGKLEAAALRAPLSDEEWEELGDDADAPVPFAWEEVLDRASKNPPRAKAKERPRPDRDSVEQAIVKAADPSASRSDGATRPR